MNFRNTYLEVHQSKIKHNYQTYLEHTQKQVFAIIKANAYGLGLIPIARLFESMNVPYLGVATLDEAMQLREHGIKSPILVMGHIDSRHLQTVKDHNITLTLPSLAYVDEIIQQKVTDLNIHIKVNTSMNRIGLEGLDEVKLAITQLKDNQNLEGIFTHYCCNDETLHKDFNTFKEIVSHCDYNFKYVHASSSNSALILKEDFTNSCRIGVGLYGGLSTHGLLNVANLYSEVIALRAIDKGDTVSYGGVFKADHQEYIATLPIGYADGILRSDRGNNVFINDKPYQIVGNICMDQMMIKGDSNINLYDKVEIFGDNTSITDIAEKRNTINYEVLTTITARVPRIYRD